MYELSKQQREAALALFSDPESVARQQEAIQAGIADKDGVLTEEATEYVHDLIAAHTTVKVLDSIESSKKYDRDYAAGQLAALRP